VNSRPILVIEDNPPLRKVVGVTLASAGYRVVEARDGRQAIERAAHQLPAVVLQDLMLPDVEAAELLGALRGLPGAADLPVIAISGSRSALDSFAHDPEAFSDCLLKPVEARRLLATVGRYAELDQRDATVGVGRGLLLVDDNRAQRELARMLLTELGFAVTVAADGAEGLERARELRPDVIVSDVLMPRLDGFELCREVRRDPGLAAVPLVLMSSSYIDDADRALAGRVGANALLERTPDFWGLADTLRQCLPSRPPPTAPAAELDAEYAQRLRAQLDRQVAANAELSQRLALQSVQLSVLAGISNVLTRSVDVRDVFGEVLARCLEVAGLAAAVVLLHDQSGGLAGVEAVGAAHDVDELRGRLEELGDGARLAPPGDLVELPASVGGNAGVAVSLDAGPEPLGVLAITWGDPHLDEIRIAFARTIAGQLSDGVALQRAIGQLGASREETISRLALAAEFRDNDTALHTERVSLYAQLLAERLGLDPGEAELIRVASVMHDVGKIGVPDTILLKPGPLTGAEFEQMKRHTQFGNQILAGSGVELLDVAASVALHHHERFDGTGYPAGLAGEAIPLHGRIVAVADVFDALTSPRVYRPAFNVDSAIETMRAGRGTQFDPRALDAFLESLGDVLAIRAGRRVSPGAPAAAP
jgi:response regulator RpfG family c-di-GMP phosphodiesterase